MGDVIAGLPPVSVIDESVADRLRVGLRKAREPKTQDLVFPGSPELHIVFRVMTDFNEVQGKFSDPSDSASTSAAEVQTSIDLLVASSIDSYALIDGQKIAIGQPLGLGLYNALFADDGTARPQTDGEAVSMMFSDEEGGVDTLSLVLFARQLSAFRKISRSVIEMAGLGK